jgi:preprotein translocase subunit SecB
MFNNKIIYNLLNIMSKENSKNIRLNSQYLKDLSFENPNAPSSIPKIANNPNITFNIDVKAGKVSEDYYEVNLNINAKAVEGDKPESVIFLVELNYAALFNIVNLTEEELKKALLIDCPTLIFPFARRIIADCTKDGGFPPLLMEPVDFAAIIAQQNQASAGQTKQ